MQDATLYDVSRGVATITLNMPERKNALGVDMIDGLGTHLAAAIADDSVRCVVLTNTGNTFCAGADLKSATPGVATREPKYSFTEFLDMVIDSPKPVIGRIAGHCTGGGVGLAAACDISVAAQSSLIGFTEVRLGVAPAVISVVVLPKMRRGDALETFLTGERLPAERAAELGIVNYAVPDEDLDTEVAEIVAKVVRGGPRGLALSKQLVARVPEMTRAEAWEWVAPASTELFQSEEGQAGIAAFRERRDAPWVPEAE